MIYSTAVNESRGGSLLRACDIIISYILMWNVAQSKPAKKKRARRKTNLQLSNFFIFHRINQNSCYAPFKLPLIKQQSQQKIYIFIAFDKQPISLYVSYLIVFGKRRNNNRGAKKVYAAFLGSKRKKRITGSSHARIQA